MRTAEDCDVGEEESCGMSGDGRGGKESGLRDMGSAWADEPSDGWKRQRVDPWKLLGEGFGVDDLFAEIQPQRSEIGCNTSIHFFRDTSPILRCCLKDTSRYFLKNAKKKKKKAFS